MPDPQPIDAPRPNHSTGPNVVSTSSTKTPEGKERCRLKRRFHSSTNAYRHGLTGQTSFPLFDQVCIVTPEERQAYDKHSEIVLEALAPVGDFERDIAQSSFPLFDRSIADDRWRLKGARSIEAGTFALGSHEHSKDTTGVPQVDDAFAQTSFPLFDQTSFPLFDQTSFPLFDQTRTWAEQARNLQLLTIYAQRIQRAMEKNRAYLEALQTKRITAAKDAMRRAKRLYELAQAQGKPYRPEDFFIAAPTVPESVFSTPEIVRELTREKLESAAHTYHWRGKLPKGD